MIRKGARAETRSERSILPPSRLRRGGADTVRVRQILRDDLVDLRLGVRLHPYVDFFQDPAALHDDPQPAGFFRVAENLFEVFDRGVARWFSVDSHEPIGGPQV